MNIDKDDSATPEPGFENRAFEEISILLVSDEPDWEQIAADRAEARFDEQAWDNYHERAAWGE